MSVTGIVLDVRFKNQVGLDMMTTSVRDACVSVLAQMTSVLEQILPADYTTPSNLLGDSTVGQHIRHALEYFLCFEVGFQTGFINYEHRAHDISTQTDKNVAATLIDRIITFVSSLQNNKGLWLETEYSSGPNKEVIQTNCMRELVYNLEHAIHHMAMVRIGLKEVAPYVVVDRDFGVAASTLRYMHHAKDIHR